MKQNDMARILASAKSALPQWAPKEINTDLCNLWLDLLQDQNDEDIINAFLTAMRTHDCWPAPSAIIRLCKGTSLSDIEIGQDIAARIEKAVKAHGMYWPEQAKKHIGELGWEVVKQCGGWSAVCEVENDTMVSERKRWRDVATIVSKNYYNSGENAAPRLPSQKENPALNLLNASVGRGF